MSIGPRDLDPNKRILYGMSGLVGCADREFGQRLARSFKDTAYVSRSDTKKIALNDLDVFSTPQDLDFGTIADIDTLMREKAQTELIDGFDVVMGSFYNTLDARRSVGEVALGSNALFVVLDFFDTPQHVLKGRRRDWRSRNITLDVGENPNFDFKRGRIDAPSYDERIDLIIELDGSEDIEELVARVDGTLEDHNIPRP